MIMDKEMVKEIDKIKQMERQFTINKKSRDQLKSQKTSNEKDNDKKINDIKEKTKNLDVRVKDEIDELKKIFYKFFVGSTENDLNNENRSKAR